MAICQRSSSFCGKTVFSQSCRSANSLKSPFVVLRISRNFDSVAYHALTACVSTSVTVTQCAARCGALCEHVAQLARRDCGCMCASAGTRVYRGALRGKISPTPKRDTRLPRGAARALSAAPRSTRLIVKTRRFAAYSSVFAASVRGVSMVSSARVYLHLL